MHQLMMKLQKSILDMKTHCIKDFCGQCFANAHANQTLKDKNLAIIICTILLRMLFMAFRILSKLMTHSSTSPLQNSPPHYPHFRVLV